MSVFLKSLFKKRTKRITQNSVKGRKNPTRKKVYSKSRKIVKRKNNYSFSSSFFSSFIIFCGFISLSLTIFFLIRQFQPFIRNERLKFLCTYQLGIKKSNYKDSKLEIEKLASTTNIAKIFFSQKKSKRFYYIFNYERYSFYIYLEFSKALVALVADSKTFAPK